MLKQSIHFVRSLAVLLCVVALGAVAVGAQSGKQTVVSPSGVFSLLLPSDYVSEPTTIPNFGDVVAFGSTQKALDTMIGVNSGTETSLAIHGTGGFVGQVDLALIRGQDPQLLVTPMMTAMSNLLTSLGAKTVQDATYHKFGQYPGLLAITDHGQIGILHDGKNLLVAVVLSDDTAVSAESLTAILDNIVFGGDVVSTGTVQPANPTAVSPANPIAPVTPEATSDAATLWRSSDNRLSVEVPADWNILDNVADANTMAYGDTLEAAQSRLASARPDLAAKQPISGNGGLVILYPAASFNVDPQKPDLSALMTQALAQLKTQGYATDAPMALESVPGGLVAYIEGEEVGYLALIPFGDQIAYVTATGTKATFDAADDMLYAIIASVHSPAAREQTGLGGLGGLQSAATPESSGLGGLSLPNETPEATS